MPLCSRVRRVFRTLSWLRSVQFGVLGLQQAGLRFVTDPIAGDAALGQDDLPIPFPLLQLSFPLGQLDQALRVLDLDFEFIQSGLRLLDFLVQSSLLQLIVLGIDLKQQVALANELPRPADFGLAGHAAGHLGRERDFAIGNDLAVDLDDQGIVVDQHVGRLHGRRRRFLRRFGLDLALVPKHEEDTHPHHQDHQRENDPYRFAEHAFSVRHDVCPTRGWNSVPVDFRRDHRRPAAGLTPRPRP